MSTASVGATGRLGSRPVVGELEAELPASRPAACLTPVTRSGRRDPIRTGRTYPARFALFFT